VGHNLHTHYPAHMLCFVLHAGVAKPVVAWLSYSAYYGPQEASFSFATFKRTYTEVRVQRPASAERCELRAGSVVCVRCRAPMPNLGSSACAPELTNCSYE
jgi:hypothetical protein